MKVNKLFAATTLALFTAGSFAAEIRGRVTDHSKSVNFEGAKVTLLEIDQSTVSDAKGQFSFNQVDPGNYTLRVDYVGSEPTSQKVILDSDSMEIEVVIGADAVRMDNILVVGQAAGQAAAINKQKNAEHMMNVLSADAVGQLPDQNVTEALQRVSGISITRDQGEGRFITVRGMDPNFNAISINGISLPSAEATGRQVALDVIPSDLIEEVTVSKTVRADKDGDALGGSIDVKSLSAFDRGGRTFNFRVEGSYNDLVDEYSPKVSATYTDLFSLGGGYDNVGVAASVSWFDRSFGSDNLETDGGWAGFELPSGEEIILPEESEQRDYTINRERLGLAFNLDFQPNAVSSFYLKTLLSDFEDDETRLRNEIKWDKGEIVSRNGNRIDFTDVEIQKELKARLETQTINSLVLGADHEWTKWKIDYSLGYSKAKEEEPNRIDATFENDFDMGLDARSSQITQFFPNDSALLASEYALDEVELTNNLTEDKETSFSINFKRYFTLADDPYAYIKFGLKQRNRDKFSDENVVVYDGFDQDYFLSDFSLNGVGHFSQPFGAAVNRSRFSSFFLSGRSGFDIDEENTRINSLGADYEVSEDITAGYLMAKYESGPNTLIGGLRIERTEFMANGVRVTIDEQINDGEPSFGDIRITNSYANYLPSINWTHEFNTRLQFRLGASKSLVRPNFGDSAPVELFEIEEDNGEVERKAEVGNPFLEALTSNNFDASIEYYPGNIGILSAGIFYKDIKNFVVKADVAGSGEYADFKEVIQPINGHDAELYGVELNYVQQMSFLPAPFDGLLLSANYTYTDSSADLGFRTKHISLPRQSDNVANLAIGYEKSGLSIRAAWTYRDSYFEEITELDNADLDLYVDDHLQFDVSAKYQVNDRLQIYAEGINLNDEPFYAYFGDRSQMAQLEKYGWTAQLGFRVFVD